MSKLLPLFSSRTFIVSGLTFGSLIHVEFIFVYDVSGPVFLCMLLSTFPKTICWRDRLYHIGYSFLLCQRLIGHIAVDSFLVFLFCSIYLYVYFCASTIFSSLQLCSISWRLELWCLQLCFSRLLWLWGASVAQSIGHLTPDFGSNHDPTVCEVEPCHGLCTDSTEPP